MKGETVVNIFGILVLCINVVFIIAVRKGRLRRSAVMNILKALISTIFVWVFFV
jgi:hypothetical protein